jgi:hypothetical protein
MAEILERAKARAREPLKELGSRHMPTKLKH